MKRALKWVGLLLGGLLVLLVIAAGTLYVIGGSKLDATVDLPAETVNLPTDSASVAWGEHLSLTQGCHDCHGENLEGRVFADAPPFLIVASNLTSGRGGVGGRFTPADWERAIRHGVRPDGTGLAPMMPARAYHDISDNEIAALIAYLESVPPVDNELPATEFRPLGRIIAGTGGLYTANEEVDHDAGHSATAPPPAPTVEYGEYRVTTVCAYCHGGDLHGGPPLGPGAPPATDLYVVTGWSYDAFETAMRTGVRPNGQQMNPEHMPWQAFRHFTDEEMQAVYMFLSTLSPAS